MKRIVLMAALVCGVMMMTSEVKASKHVAMEQQADDFPITIASYNLNSTEDFSFSYDFELKLDGSFNLPFASHLYISGNHLEFSVTNEEFRHYFVQPGKSYYDLQINFRNNIGGLESGFIRIFYNE